MIEADYQEFLAKKIIKPSSGGFDVDNVNPMLFDWQAEIVKWACKKGKSAIFAGCGLGKTPMQLEWANLVCEHTGGNVLILAPLAVSLQTVHEGEKFGIKVNLAKNNEQVRPGINITNYEMLDKFDVSQFSGVVLDESSILKSFTGKTRKTITDTFSSFDYKLACTATPAPNDYVELGNHSEFLDVLSNQEMLAKFFINNTSVRADGQEGWRLKRHGVKAFWEWVLSWAVCLEMPSDIGYPDNGFVLPPLHMHEVIVKADVADFANGKLFKSERISATDMHREMRETSKDRAQAVADMVNTSPDTWIIWCNTNYEADDLKRRIPEAKEIRGSDSIDKKESLLFGFSQGDFRVLLTKPSIAGFGLNWQHCHKMAFVGLSYSFEQQYQAIRRCWRFGQEKPVDVYMVMAETEIGIYRAVQAKSERHAQMVNEMMGEVRQISHTRGDLKMVSESKTHKAENWEIINGDCVTESRKIPENHIDFSIFSPPFAQLFVYSNHLQDMGNCSGDDEFFQHFNFLIPELLRITKPGRLCAVHCSVLPLFKHQTGYIGLKDFRGDIIQSFLKHGWIYHSEVCIWKDPVVEMQRTKALGLLHKQIKKDSSMCRQGIPDYVCVFRKPGENQFPITHTPQDFSVDKWQRWASPVWFDINQTNTLNKLVAKEEKDEKHICPLQLEVIERCIELWTNPGELVFSPFAGIGSEGYESIRLGRKFLGIELKEKYVEIAVKNLQTVERQRSQNTLFAAND